MSNDKLEVGGECFDVLSGNRWVISASPFKPYCFNIAAYGCTKDGKINDEHKYPRFITISEARKRGLLPKEPVVVAFEATIERLQPVFACCVLNNNLDKYIDKRCKVVVTILEEEKIWKIK